MAESPQLHIRPVLPGDIPLLRRMSIETCEDTFGPFNSREIMDAYIAEAFSLTQLEQELFEAGSAYFFVCHDATPIGFMRVRVTDEVADRLGQNTLELQRIYVLSEHKGKGAGSFMLNEAIRMAKVQERDWLWLGVWERNFPAQKFYNKRGFERFGEHVFMMGEDRQTDWLLKLKIER